MAPLILDGSALARRRAPGLRERAARVLASRGRPPRLLLIAFESQQGRAPWVSGKTRALDAAGVAVDALVLPHDVTAEHAERAFDRGLRTDPPDGVFVQFPFPEGFDGDALAARIPLETDIDVMGPGAIAAYLSDASKDPPLTVAATLALIDRHDLALAGRQGVVVGDPIPFNRMFQEALVRRGAPTSLVPLDADDLGDRLAAATLVVTSVAQPRALRSRTLAPGTVAVDGGYFNARGVGDIDLVDGIDQLEALVPVPGGIGPMTVSTLVEAVIAHAENIESTGHPTPNAP